MNYKYKSVDDFKESDFVGNLREYLESNSFLYKNFRLLKAKLYLSYNIQKGANIVNKKGVVYGERSKKKFINYKEFQSNNGINKLLSQKKLFDLIFIDADKENYKKYYELSLNLLKRDGFIIIDIVLWHGEVVDKNNKEHLTEIIRDFNTYVNNDIRVENMIIPIGDGFSICRKL